MQMNLLLSTALCSLLAFTSCKKEDTSATSPITTTNPQAITVVPQSAVPAAVVSSFNASFAGASEVEWQRSSNHFEVEFNHQGQHHDCSFDDNGHQSSHNISCATSAVPAAVLSAFRARNPTDNVYEWNSKADGSWKAHFYRNNVKWETLFSASGTFIKEEHD